MPATLPGIIYESDIDDSSRKVVPIIDAVASMYQIPYTKNEEFFSNLDSYTKFIKGAERLVRHSDRYSKYKDYLIREIGMDHCEVFKDVTNADADIEMHHGPVFTLYDYCAIMVEWFLIHKWKISTFRIANEVLAEHEANRVQVVMLASTIHAEVHERNIFINMKQAWGDLGAFINKYAEAISPDLRDKLNRYIDRSLMSDSDDYGTLELNKKLYE